MHKRLRPAAPARNQIKVKATLDGTQPWQASRITEHAHVFAAGHLDIPAPRARSQRARAEREQAKYASTATCQECAHSPTRHLGVGGADGSLDDACEIMVQDARGARLHVVGKQVDKMPHKVALPE